MDEYFIVYIANKGVTGTNGATEIGKEADNMVAKAACDFVAEAIRQLHCTDIERVFFVNDHGDLCYEVKIQERNN